MIGSEPALQKPATQASRRLLSAVFSFPTAMTGLLAALSCLVSRSRLSDPDLWWHLKLGQIIWTTRAIPLTDLFSWTTNHHATIPHEWLSEITIYGAYLIGGYGGLMGWLFLFSSALLIAGYVLCSLYTRNPKISFLGAMCIWYFSLAGQSIRPQMIGYLLLILELVLLDLGRTRSHRWFFGLPPLFAIWVNVHSSYALGLMVLAIFLLTSFVPFEAGLLSSPAWPPRARRSLLIALLLSVACLFCNPIGWKLLTYPLNTIFSQTIGLSVVDEWKPLDMSHSRGLAVIGVSAAVLLSVIVRRSKLMGHELLLLALAIWLAASHRRMTFVFGILVAPMLCRLLSDLWDGYQPKEDRPLPNAVLLAVCLLTVALSFPSRANLAEQVEQNNPVHAVEFIRANHLGGHMLNEYVYGGYLIWAAPEYPVFIDGRADVFEWSGVFTDFSRWELLQADPNSLLEKYRIDFCLLARSSPMVTVMSLLPNWKVSYEDNDSVIFVRTADNQANSLR